MDKRDLERQMLIDATAMLDEVNRMELPELTDERLGDPTVAESYKNVCDKVKSARSQLPSKHLGNSVWHNLYVQACVKALWNGYYSGTTSRAIGRGLVGRASWCGTW